MDEASAKDRLIEEMRENERLRSRVKDLEVAAYKWECTARALASVCGVIRKAIEDITDGELQEVEK